jgi:hypothetical protein
MARMPKRKLSSFAAVVALAVFGLSSLHAAAQEADAKKEAKKAVKKSEPGKSGGKGKMGDACKVAADCDQSGDAMLCGRGKCEYDVSKINVET